MSTASPRPLEIVDGNVNDIWQACLIWIKASADRSRTHKRTYRFFIRLSSLLFALSIILSSVISGSLFSTLGDEGDNVDKNDTIKLITAIMAAVTAVADGLNKVVSMEAEKHKNARVSYARVRRRLEHLLLKYPNTGANVSSRKLFLDEYMEIIDDVDSIMNKAPAAMSCFWKGRAKQQEQPQQLQSPLPPPPEDSEGSAQVVTSDNVDNQTILLSSIMTGRKEAVDH